MFRKVRKSKLERSNRDANNLEKTLRDHVKLLNTQGFKFIK